MDMKSYVISHVSSRLPGPVRKRPRSGSNAPLFESNAAAPRPLRLSVLFGFKIRLQWFISPFKASRDTRPAPPSPRLGDLSVIILMHRSMTVRLRRGGIPLHKLTIEKVCVGCVGRQLQDLENDVSSLWRGYRRSSGCTGQPQSGQQCGLTLGLFPGNLWHSTGRQ